MITERKVIEFRNYLFKACVCLIFAFRRPSDPTTPRVSLLGGVHNTLKIHFGFFNKPKLDNSV